MALIAAEFVLVFFLCCGEIESARQGLPLADFLDVSACRRVRLFEDRGRRQIPAFDGLRLRLGNQRAERVSGKSTSSRDSTHQN